MKHRNFLAVPRDPSFTTKRLIKRCCITKHAIDFGKSIYIPSRNVLVKFARVTEHELHFSDQRNIPSRNVLIESCRRIKHSIH